MEVEGQKLKTSKDQLDLDSKLEILYDDLDSKYSRIDELSSKFLSRKLKDFAKFVLHMKGNFKVAELFAEQHDADQAIEYISKAEENRNLGRRVYGFDHWTSNHIQNLYSTLIESTSFKLKKIIGEQD